MHDQAAAPLLNADTIESSLDSMVELLDLSKQQRNLLLLRPLFQLELNKRAVGKDVASENALFEGIDTHYLVLSALDFMMESTSINLGCTHAEVLEQLAAVAQAMCEDLTIAQTRRIAEVVLVMLPPYSSPRPSRNKPPGPLMAPAALVRPAAS